jgi:phosphatidylglycerol:prolipoprotein diacylglycerol transferase
LTFPSAVAFYIGSWPVRWYGVLYGLGVAASMMYSQKCVRQGYFANLYEDHVEGFINYAVISIVIGARLGHFLLYDYRMMTQNPVRLLYVWEGGLSFHGGMFGFLVGLWWYAKMHKVHVWRFADALACGVPIGLFLGRIGNFINQELYGYPTSQPWGVVFPMVDHQHRHPSQLYEAGLEGVALFLILRFLMVRYAKKWPAGRISACFILFYGIFRSVGEIFRVPEDGTYWGITWGQWYSLPMIVWGIVWLCVSYRGRHKKDTQHIEG